MKTILLIDDDEACRQPTAEVLRREHWHVIEAEDGRVGIDMAVEHRPDIVLCDLLMPRVNGYQVCRAIREHLELRHTRIIVVTGRDYASDRKSAEEAGADGYIVKPLEYGQLKDLLARMAPSDPSGNGITAATEAPRSAWEADATRLKFWGVRGSIPSPGAATVQFGGNTSCVELRAGGRIFVLDAGSGIRPLGHSLTEESAGAPIEVTLLITHTHWDHIQGFPFFVPAYDALNRIQIYGYEGARSGLHAALAGQMESPYFPVSLSEMPGNLRIEELRDMALDLGGVRIESCFTNHPGICVGYKLHTPDGVVAYVPDNETKCGRPDAVTGKFLPDPSEARIAAFLHEVDVAIVDCQYTREEYEAHIGWGHGCIDEVVRMAMECGVKRLYPFHHDPTHDDAFLAEMQRYARGLVEKAGSSMQVEAAQEGMELVLRNGAVQGPKSVAGSSR